MRQQLKRSVDAGLHGWPGSAPPIQARAQRAEKSEGQGFRPAVAHHSLGKIAVDEQNEKAKSLVPRPKWNTVGGASSRSTPPSHNGRYGEEFDHTCSQGKVAQAMPGPEFVPKKVNQGRMGKEYENDMIRGGPDTIKVSVKKLIELWAKSQNNPETLSQEAIEEYVSLIEQSGYIDAPFFASIDFGGEDLEIRTSEGRHRIKAAEKAGLTTIYILKPAEESMEMVKIVGVAEELFPE